MTYDTYCENIFSFFSQYRLWFNIYDVNSIFMILIQYSYLFFSRFGRVQSVKILGHNKDDDHGGGEAATVAFMDIKSANKAHR